MPRFFRTLLISLFVYSSIFAQKKVDYPITNSDCKETIYFDTKVVDCYSWLEDIQSEAVINWVAEQDKLTNNFINGHTDKLETYDDLAYVSDIGIDLVNQVDGMFFKYKHLNTGSSPSLFYKKNYNAYEKLIVDPADISVKDNINISNFRVSENKEFLAYSFNRNGSDLHEIKLKKFKGKDPEDHLNNILSTTIEWKGNGFYYMKVKQDGFLSNYIMEGIFYHTLGTEQSQDEQIFFNVKGKNTLIKFQLTEDKRFLLIFERDVITNLISLYCIDYASHTPVVSLILKDSPLQFDVIGNIGNNLLARTNVQGNFGYLVLIDINNPTSWEKLTPEIENTVLQEAYLLKDKILCLYLQNSTDIFIFYNYEGEIINVQKLPNGIHATGINACLNDSILLFYISNEIIPPIGYTLNINTFKVELEKEVYIRYESKDIEWQNISMYTRDSTEIILDIYYKKNSPLTNKLSILKTYGGFGIIPKNSFNPSMISFILEENGIYAFAHIRGGGEKGVDWANAGKRLNKQKSIDDFIEAAEYLIEKGYTSPSKLAITGASHGGLIVAAAAIQRPELFKVVVPEMGVYDMLNFEKYTVGNLHVNEFGSIENFSDFKNLIKYSPYHSIKHGVNYPSMLVITSGNDERVPPFHSYKFIAALQNNPGQENMILLRCIKNYGHQGGTSYYNRIMENAETISFILKKLNEKN